MSDVVQRPAVRRTVATAAVALGVLTSIAAVGQGGEPWIALVYAAVVVFALNSPGALAVQSVIGVVMVAALLIGPAGSPVAIAPLVAAVVATAELLALVARLNSPIPRDVSDLLLRAGASAVLAAAIFLGVSAVAELPGPLGLAATALASGSVLVAALALVRGRETDPR